MSQRRGQERVCLQTEAVLRPFLNLPSRSLARLRCRSSLSFFFFFTSLLLAVLAHAPPSAPLPKTIDPTRRAGDIIMVFSTLGRSLVAVLLVSLSLQVRKFFFAVEGEAPEAPVAPPVAPRSRQWGPVKSRSGRGDSKTCVRIESTDKDCARRCDRNAERPLVSPPCEETPFAAARPTLKPLDFFFFFRPPPPPPQTSTPRNSSPLKNNTRTGPGSRQQKRPPGKSKATRKAWVFGDVSSAKAVFTFSLLRLTPSSSSSPLPPPFPFPFPFLSTLSITGQRPPEQIADADQRRARRRPRRRPVHVAAQGRPRGAGQDDRRPAHRRRRVRSGNGQLGQDLHGLPAGTGAKQSQPRQHRRHEVFVQLRDLRLRQLYHHVRVDATRRGVRMPLCHPGKRQPKPTQRVPRG